MAPLTESTGRHRSALGNLSWEPMQLGADLLDGFEWARVPIGDPTWQAYWMRVAPGARSKEHVHPATELLFVHEGVLIDMDGARYLPGDTVVFPAGSSHWTWSSSGCLALVVTGQEARVMSTDST